MTDPAEEGAWEVRLYETDRTAARHRGTDDVRWLEQLQPRRHRLPCGSRYALDREVIAYVLDGMISAAVFDDGGSEMSYALRGSGSAVGLEHVVGVGVTYELHALVDSTLMIVSRAVLACWIARQDTTTQQIVRLALHALADTTSDQVGRAGTAVQRAARYVALVNDAPHHTSQLPQREVAFALGMRPETFCRALKQLKDMGAIELTPTPIVADAQALSNVLSE